ncbi:cytochrome c oxidase subunit II [Sphingomonas sp.]|jgi:cytochrome c oxidase subunit 2|uniref:cytochrome c oxidase subunit II n=1 Tax=Sphingomonas sp. TaxID=28214 RepID=UPI002D80D321|nr:cytochrome c oxidase subunit II [Sphingomonas sp.]HEU0045714.1 cytochrome c oxidase subunit II [Sphingomonas sp.]
MRIRGLLKLAAAAALACGGLTAAGAQQGSANVPGAANTTPTTAAAAPTAQPASPLLAQNGAPVIVADPEIGRPQDHQIGIQPQVTRNGEFASWFHNIILMPLITAISVFVLALLVWVVIRYRKAANPIPSKTSHNTAIEIAWTVIPVLLLVLIAIPSIGLLQAQFKPAPANAVTLKATGNQWYWTYSYPDYGDFEITANMLKERDQVTGGERFRTDADGPRLLAVDNRVVLPVGVPIRLITTSADVIHSWALPAFWFKLDAVPGRLNESSFTIEKPGLYFGQCSELCGARHPFMPIAVQAVDRATFARWVVAKGGKLPGAAEAAAPSGAVIPQPGAAGNPTETPGEFTVPPAGPNPGTPALPATPQGATRNSQAGGNPGQ